MLVTRGEEDHQKGGFLTPSTSLLEPVFMVVVAQLVEPWIVIPVVVGSSPISHPIQNNKLGLIFVSPCLFSDHNLRSGDYA